MRLFTAQTGCANNHQSTRFVLGSAKKHTGRYLVGADINAGDPFSAVLQEVVVQKAEKTGTSLVWICSILGNSSDKPVPGTSALA